MHAALLAVALAAGQADVPRLQAVLHAWRNTPAAAAVATQVVVSEAAREGVASVEPCVIAWEASIPKVAFRQGGLTVVLDGDRLKAAHEAGDAAVDRTVGKDRLAAWNINFAEMPWPQPGLALAPEADALRVFDPEAGALEVKSVEVQDDGGVKAQLQGPRGTWMLRFRGERAPKLIEAERTITSGPRVPANGRITWKMHFEPAEMESGVWMVPVEGRRRVDRVEDALPAKAKKPKPKDAAPVDAQATDGESPKPKSGDSIPSTP
ncbi:MAG: hypothetical protein LW625_08885 [Planctomycetaceae bacterium]|nr:hypothetical protein [Planctomycetaceae bacterium]